MRIDILTLFPEMFTGPFDQSIMQRAREKGLLELFIWNIRDFTTDRHRVVDDTPYGGGPGMVLKPEPIFAAVETVSQGHREPGRIILLSPQGKPFNQKVATNLAQEKRLILLCGHYEGFDERIRQGLTLEEISIGDYVLTGGELPAMVLVDAVVRLIPGVLGESRSHMEDSFSEGLLEHPHYTKPRLFRGMEVPEVLLSGHHEKIARWRRKEALRRTWLRRPELLETAPLTEEDRKVLAMIIDEEKDRG
ncbi:MAG: tRNA (guanosine(37)-N1)-methyltransferase TrmD [Limnochordia bacterium]|jgi:tRNA (guanine37-N1)-methyltransferase